MSINPPRHTHESDEKETTSTDANDDKERKEIKEREQRNYAAKMKDGDVADRCGKG